MSPHSAKIPGWFPPGGGDALTVDTSEIQERFVEETRQKFADAGYDPSKEDVRILVTRLPAALFESLFGRLLQPMHGAEARPAPRTNEIYIEQAKQIAELETELAALNARRCEGCTMWWPTETGNYAGCPVEYERDAENAGGDTPADFACNRWTACGEE